MLFIIFPNHLFESVCEKMRNCKEILIIEEPIHFGDTVYRPFHINKVKLAFMRASMRAYYDYLRKKVNVKVHYIDYEEANKPSFIELLKKNECLCYNPYDVDVIRKYKDFKCALRIIQDSPLFLMSREKNAWYVDHMKAKRFSNADYYKFVKKELGVLEGEKSYDSENRKAYPRGHVVTDDLFVYTKTGFDKYYKEAIKYIEGHPSFRGNCGNIANVIHYPITFSGARLALQNFLKVKLERFGDFQDAIDEKSVVGYHSFLSACLNVGLLTPDEVVKSVMEYGKKNKIGMNNLEGFIRQVVGWREYMHMLYEFKYNDIVASNLWKNSRGLNWNVWYGDDSGELDGFALLKKELDKCIDYAYAHHIVRLMLFLNMFVMLEVNPWDIRRWFMEVCAIDAWDWVMVSNIWCMGYFTGGEFMRKPYLATANYLFNMSNYKKESEIQESFSALYYGFLHSHKDIIKKHAPIYLRNLTYFEKMTTEAKGEVMKKRAEVMNLFTAT